VDSGVLVVGTMDGDFVIVGVRLIDARLVVTLLSGATFCEAASLNS
jgi:hypothetical protein